MWVEYGHIAEGNPRQLCHELSYINACHPTEKHILLGMHSTSTYVNPVGDHGRSVRHLYLDSQSGRASELVTKLKQSIWKCWSLEYLHTLHQRTKWSDAVQKFKPDVLVLVKDSNLPPLRWKMARIVKLHAGKEGVVRVTTVRTLNGELSLPRISRNNTGQLVKPPQLTRALRVMVKFLSNLTSYGDVATGCQPVNDPENKISCSFEPVEELAPWEFQHLHLSTIWIVCKVSKKTQRKREKSFELREETSRKDELNVREKEEGKQALDADWRSSSCILPGSGSKRVRFSLLVNLGESTGLEEFGLNHE
ncbi:hypothetical protein PR048_005729 [Dryococelus australis]|uniref:DUF5641 domain-containing protein n=1 Tax=Dryococelus australis TaxID=614101 RepID=A0ABQ9I953_9NEOP|nr:hypothetical protein PR048_005729 [Dryococelus australis]